jgi:hypothetical protein
MQYSIEPTTRYSIEVIQPGGENYWQRQPPARRAIYAKTDIGATLAMRHWLAGHRVEGQVYLAWYRARDGAADYLNADGSVGITGRPWPKQQ